MTDSCEVDSATSLTTPSIDSALAEVDRLISEAYSEAYGRHGDLGIDLNVFGEHVRSIIKKLQGEPINAAAAESLLRRLYIYDLYVSCACAAGSELGWERFSKRYRSLIAAMVRFFAHREPNWADFADGIMVDLFLPDRSGRSRISSYDGRSTLATWLRVIVYNRVINNHELLTKSRQVVVSLGATGCSAAFDIDSSLKRERYRIVWTDALARACQQLTHHQRLLMIWRYEQHLQLGEIARMLGIHQSNVTRQLERIQAHLRNDVISLLSLKHGLSKSAIQECLDDMVENPDHSISIISLLKKDSAAKPMLARAVA